MNYGTAIPPLPPLASADGQARAGHDAATGIGAGTALVLMDVTNAQKETESRKWAQYKNHDHVTEDEMAAAIVREHAVVASHASQAYAGAGAPAWFAPAMANALAPVTTQLNNLTTQQNNLTTQLNNLTTHQNNLTTQLNNLTTQLNDLRGDLRHAESRAVSRSYNSSINTNDTRLEILVGNNGVIPANFPADITALRGLSALHVNGLLTAYGQNLVGTVEERRRRLATFIGANHYF
jgi:hypothetical protein